jgi:carbonic anhydrase/acetyltransferase-like protein (isoleucine patch superfamily)
VRTCALGSRFALFTAIGSLRARTTLTTLTTLSAIGTTIATVGSFGTLATLTIATALGPLSTAAVAALRAVSLRSLLDNRLEGLLARQQLEHGRVGLQAAVHDRKHRDAVDLLLDFDLVLVADLGVAREDRRVDDAPGLPRARSSPRPRAVRTRTRKFDVDPAGHGDQRYPLHSRLGFIDTGGRSLRYVRRVPIYALDDQVPAIDPNAYVHPDAVVIGSVTIGPGSSVWPGAVLRGDDGYIVVGARSCIQDNSVLHTTAEHPTIVGDDCVIGHIVHLEGCTIESGAMVANGAIVLHRSVVRSGAIVAANAVVLYDVDVPSGAIAVGAPATIKPDRARLDDITSGSESYVARALRFRSGLRRIEQRPG